MTIRNVEIEHQLIIVDNFSKIIGSITMKSQDPVNLDIEGFANITTDDEDQDVTVLMLIPTMED